VSYWTKGALNLPLASDAAIRMVLTHTSNAGWIDSVVPASYSDPTPGLPVRWRNANSSDSTSARLELLWEPTDTLTVRPSLIYQESGLGDNIQGSYKAAWGDVRPQIAPEGGTIKLGIASLTLDRRFDQFTLTSASNVVLRRKDVYQDYSEAVQSFAPAFGFANVLYPGPFKDTHYDIGYSQEIRATSTAPGPLHWIGGVYYNLSEGHETEDQRSAPFAQLLGLASHQLLYYDVPVKDVQIAGFGEANYSFDDDRFELAAGARVYRVNSQLTVNWLGPLGAPDTPLTKSSASGVSPRVSFTFKPSSLATLYTTYSEGFRPGGPNPGEATVGDPYVNCSFYSLYKTSYNPDKSKNIEVGVKMQPVPAFSTNLAVYQLNWSNFQATVSSSCGTFNDNLGNARNRGVEWEAQARLGSNFSTYGGLSFNDGVITSVSAPVAAAGALEVGQRLINSPRIQANLGVEANFPLKNSTRIYVRANWQYSGETPTIYGDTALAVYEREAYRNVDTSIGWQTAAWDLDVFGRNLTNDPQIQTIAQSYVLGPDLFPGRPRTFGVEVRYSFH
jgi:iron complex outermembrane receptor protein